MIDLLILICIMGVILGIMLGIVAAVDGQEVCILFFLVAVVCGISIFSMVKSDVDRNNSEQNFKERIGVVSEMTGKEVKVDDHKYERVIEYSQATFENIKLGETVKIKFIDGQFGNYITQIAPVTVEVK
jgi:hypothetical protein